MLLLSALAAADADLNESGDAHWFELGSFRNIAIMNPADALAHLIQPRSEIYRVPYSRQKLFQAFTYPGDVSNQVSRINGLISNSARVQQLCSNRYIRHGFRKR